MMPISLAWDSREKSILIKWDGFFSFGWEEGKKVKKLWKIPIPYSPGVHGDQKIRPRRIRWVYLKAFLSFLREWKLKRVEGSLSFPDPMVNGILYGWLSAMESEKESRKTDLTINFLGENWCSGEATVAPRVLFHYLKRWGFSLLSEMRRG